jgi:hypothetical protein
LVPEHRWAEELEHRWAEELEHRKEHKLGVEEEEL